MSRDANGDWSPNQLAKRQQIVEAAKVLLTQEGLAGTTARALADVGPLTKSAIHYYFADMDEIVDLAMGQHMAAFVEIVRAAADGAQGDGRGQLRAAIAAYLATFAERPGTAFLWFSYWADASSRGRADAVEANLASVTELLRDLLAGAGVGADDAGARAHALLSWLLGTVVQQVVRPLAFDDLVPELAAVTGVEL
jgi:AcrR family transcriptional regulator